MFNSGASLFKPQNFLKKIIGKGKLLRVSIKILLFILTFDFISFGQISSFGGDVRYQFQYHDVTASNSLSKFYRHSPRVSLRTSGYILSPSIASINLSSSLFTTFNQSYSKNYSFSSKQLSYNYYNIGLSILPEFIIRCNINASENEVESQSKTSQYSENPSNFRNQQQRINLTTDKIDFLPNVSFTVGRSRNWSVSSISNIDQTQYDYSLSMSKGTSNSNISLSGYLNESYEKSTDFYNRYYRFQLNGMKEISKTGKLNFNSEHYRHSMFAFTSANATYADQASEKLRYQTLVSGRIAETEITSNAGYSFSQSINYAIEKNYHIGYSINGGGANDYFITDKRTGLFKKVNSLGFGNGLSFSHNRQIGTFGFGNGLSVGYARQFTPEEQYSVNYGISNSFNTNVYGFDVNGNFDISGNRTYLFLERKELTKTASMLLTTRLWNIVSSESVIDYRDENISEENLFDRNYKQMRINQRLHGSTFYYIPMNLSFSGSVYFNFSPKLSKNYNANFSFSSPYFFVTNLSFGYSLSLSYEPFYKRTITDHTAEFRYSWRALQFQLKLREYKYVNNRRDVLFTLVRPF